MAVAKNTAEIARAEMAATARLLKKLKVVIDLFLFVSGRWGVPTDINHFAGTVPVLKNGLIQPFLRKFTRIQILMLTECWDFTPFFRMPVSSGVFDAR
ncbi:hypothetical protein GCM10023115_23310 [Pontixanthobacter gangjinensis]|uniref:Uncharacterized protein n=1 Tax=Pontixanthobacter gangjinensis TaxID=1028742 RepID=A0A6I4SRC0_9SPHN|nr:hypothetical protein [Pontixanthobacter gangjinensis]MXO57576.1 hypothetical protein [Pontixanthobacter gangjinensis]